MAYYRWSTGQDVSLILDVVKADGTGLTGSDPQIMIRRYKSMNGNFLDNYYWNGSTFVSTPTSASMTEIDAVNQPGQYAYNFSQSLIGAENMYAVLYKHNSTPQGFVSEYHYFISGSSDAVTVRVYESEVD